MKFEFGKEFKDTMRITQGDANSEKVTEKKFKIIIDENIES